MVAWDKISQPKSFRRGKGAEEGKGEGLGFKGLAKMNIVSLADYIGVFSRRRGNYGAGFERKIWRREEGECWL